MPIATSAEDAPPQRLGPYRLGELIGKGGMGRVYRAERADGVFEQTIAIKLMRRTQMPALVAEQFARERQILARLQHRNIAQLLDGGVTPEGHSYFVMELVAGRPITQYARDERLGLRQTLWLFRQVCRAVQYAHSHLVVHADIKPNNIIVTAEGAAKLLDFGVARVIDESGQDSAARSSTLGLTYDYASPARQRGEAPTTIDDVYSLGVLLGELLQRFRVVPPDLGSVATRARAAEPEARYPSVEALQADVERWLAGEPVQAHGAAWSYVARKFLARYQFVVAVSVSCMLLLAGAAVAFALMYVRAEQAKSQAEERFKDLRSLSRFVLFDVYDRLEAMPRALTLRRDIADAGQRYLDRLVHDPDAPLEVRLEVIEGLRRLAQVQASPGAASLAQVPLARANLEHAEALALALPEGAATRRTRALVLARIALARSKIASEKELDAAASRKALDEAGASIAQLLRDQPNDRDALSLQADRAVELAGTLEWQGQYAEAIKTAREALARPALVATSPEETRTAVLAHARLLDILAEGLYYSGDPAAAEQPYREQFALLRDLSASRSLDVGISRRLAHACWALAMTLLELQRPREAEPILAAATTIVERLRLLEPDDQDLVRVADITAGARAQALVMLKRFAEAEPLLERSLNERERLWNEAPEDWSRARDYAIALARRADARIDAGRIADACTDYRQTITTFDRIRAAGKLAKLDEDYALRLIHENVASHCQLSGAR